MKKTIHIYSQYYYPVTNAVSIRTREYIKALTNDYNVKVITWMPNYPIGIKDKKYKWRLYKKEIWEFWEEIIRTYEFANKNEWTFLRLFNYVSFMTSSFFYWLFNKKPDLIIVISPPLFTAIWVYFFSKIRNIKFISEIHDLWPDSVVAFDILSKNSFFYKIFKFFEIKIYKSSTYILWLTKWVIQWIINNWIEKNKVYLNYFVVDTIKHPPLLNPYINLEQKIKNRQVILFAWNMNEAYDFSKTIQFIKENNNIYFVFIWDGSQKKYLEKHTALFDNIIFFNRMNKNQVEEYLYYCNAVLVPLKDEEFYKWTFPVKWIEWIVNNKEIIFFWPKDWEFNIFLEKYQKWWENKNIFSSDYFWKNIKNLVSKVI